MNWHAFIENFQGKKLEQPISCENGIGICKSENYAIRVYRCIWNNGWKNDLGEIICEPFEALCTPSFGSDIECEKWIESSTTPEGSIIYSYYIKIESCDCISTKPNLPQK